MHPLRRNQMTQLHLLEENKMLCIKPFTCPNNMVEEEEISLQKVQLSEFGPVCRLHYVQGLNYRVQYSCYVEVRFFVSQLLISQVHVINIFEIYSQWRRKKAGSCRLATLAYDQIKKMSFWLATDYIYARHYQNLLANETE